MQTPEQIEGLKRIAEDGKTVFGSNVVKLLLAALEESQQRIGKLELYIKSLEFNREDTQKRANEKLRERDTKLAEAQQTIARHEEALNGIIAYSTDKNAVDIASESMGYPEDENEEKNADIVRADH